MGHPASIDNAVCGALAITAAEGGIGYWSQIDTYKPSRWDPAGGVDSVGSVDGRPSIEDGFVFYRIAPLADDGGGYDWSNAFDITPAVIKRGWRIAWSKYRWNLDTENADETDSLGADVVIQCGIFGEIVYG